MSQQNRDTPGALTSVVGFVSVMGLFSAILSVSGFLVLRSHANLLGLSNFLHHSVTDYIYEGGLFFYHTVQMATGQFIARYWVLIAVGFLILTVKQFGRFQDRFRKIEGKWTSVRTRLSKPIVQFGCIVLVASLMIWFINGMYPSRSATDLLFPTADQREAAKRADEKSIEALQLWYIDSLLYVIVSGTLLFLIHKIPKGTEDTPSLSPLYLLPFRSTSHFPVMPKKGILYTAGRGFLYMLFFFQLILLPIDYGQSVYPNDFHKVTELVLDKKLRPQVPDSENRWLINETENSFLIYYGNTQELRLLSKGQVYTISISAQQNIFTPFKVK